METPQNSPTAGKRVVKIDQDEWWPVYSLSSDGYHYGHDVELPEETIEWVERVQREFEEVQSHLSAIYEKEVRGH